MKEHRNLCTNSHNENLPFDFSFQKHVKAAKTDISFTKMVELSDHGRLEQFLDERGLHSSTVRTGITCLSLMATSCGVTKIPILYV